ncbi:MAG: methionine-rich copper-binding protein CopC [Psychromonas sp.]|jgi:methionine-rich copper-binding protein CopC|uniref:copper resistance CopC family protein n=1 Tax=Psychromonas sp. TaxID=1884585 RepID=UPI0039E6E7A0
MKIFINIAILSLLVLSNLAIAHSHLKLSFPKYGSELNTPPEDLILEFSSQVKLVKLQLIDESGEKIKLNVKPSENFKTSFSIALPILDSGSYNVKWMAMGKDAHKLKGDLPFTVGSQDQD